MTLLISVFAAIIVTVKWYMRKDDSMQLGILVFMEMPSSDILKKVPISSFRLLRI